MAKNESTLVASERAWASVTWTLLCALFVASLVLWGVSAYGCWCLEGTGLAVRFCWVVCLCVWLGFTGSNVRFLVFHHKPTVGLMPPAVFSLVPAALAAVVASPDPGWRCASAVVLVVAGVMSLVFIGWFIRLKGAYAGWQIPKSEAVIIVLGAAVKQGRPSTTLALRLEQAALCARENPHCTLVLTGGPLSDQEGTEADVMARYLIERGVSPTRIIVERRARNTRENIAFALDFVGKQGLSGKLYVLTSDYHLYRARSLGRACGVELSPIPAATPKRSRLQQWCREVLTILYER